MDRTFSNADAGICGGVALAEVIFFIVYMVVTSRRLREKIISMGRLIPAMPVVVIAGHVPGVITAYPNTYQHPYPQPPTEGQQPPPPQPPGFRDVYDLPPPYSELGPPK